MARVFVNRVWQQLFGRGIVETSENFGASGSPPSHPELLDFLATEFMAGEWRVKRLIRLLVNSSAYRQSSAYGVHHPALAAGKDPENSLWWRMPLRRLEAEIIRDRMLAVSGLLDRTAGGHPIMHAPGKDGIVRIAADGLPTPTAKWRRSVYLLARRRYHLPMLEAFDLPEVSGACLRRSQGPAVTQTLIMMNNGQLHEIAAAFARRVESDTEGQGMSDRVQRAFALSLGREPSNTELSQSLTLLEQQSRRYLESGQEKTASKKKALEHLCRALFNASEFLYVP